MTHSENATDLAHRLAPGADDAPAIAAPERTTLSHGGLRRVIGDTVARLNELGIGRGDRVAIVLPNGPEMASSFLAVACGATTAPLNPAYREEELEFYLSDLRAKALIVTEAEEGPSLTVARRHGAKVLRLRVPQGAPAGLFELHPEGEAGVAAAGGGYAGPHDVALVLHTSGTTSRPKIVPLLHRNLAASARHIGATLSLTPDDRCLNIMPLFHIHGLIAATLSSMAAGASTYCSPGFNALRFFGWLDEAKPTWYTAVPTMHQAILVRAARNTESVGRARLRFIRSSSASLPPQVMKALEETFRCPVIESYGITEASHQMASNPLPPAPRKPGSVGIAAGPQVRIADDDNGFLPAGGIGEIVISGPNVTPGYESNPEANAKAFFEADGRRWFRTGDQGTMDEQGYVRLTGRLKEI